MKVGLPCDVCGDSIEAVALAAQVQAFLTAESLALALDSAHMLNGGNSVIKALQCRKSAELVSHGKPHEQQKMVTISLLMT
jgi:hypothetical protein